MERAEFRASVRFSRNAVKSLFDFGLVMARSSTVSGTATLIILLKEKKHFIFIEQFSTDLKTTPIDLTAQEECLPLNG